MMNKNIAMLGCMVLFFKPIDFAELYQKLQAAILG